MISYVTLGTNDLERASAFYDALLAEMGASRMMQNERMVLWATQPGAPMLAVCTPYDTQAASAGNGTMVALAAADPETAARVHAKALELGGSDEGAPGARGQGFYGAYFRDLDGNKLVACVFG